MAAEVAAFGDVLDRAAGHDAFILPGQAEIAQALELFALRQGRDPRRHSVFRRLPVVPAGRHFQGQGRTGEDLLHDRSEFGADGFGVRVDAAGDIGNEFVVRQFPGVAEGFDWRNVGQDAVHDDRMAPAEGIHIPAGLRFFHEFDQAVLIREDRMQGDFLQQIDEFVQVLRQAFGLEAEDRHVVLVVRPVRKGRHAVVDAARVQVDERRDVPIRMVCRIHIADEVAQQVDIGNFFPCQAVEVEVGIDISNAVRFIRDIADRDAAYILLFHGNRVGLLFQVVPGQGRNRFQGFRRVRRGLPLLQGLGVGYDGVDFFFRERSLVNSQLVGQGLVVPFGQARFRYQ